VRLPRQPGVGVHTSVTTTSGALGGPRGARPLTPGQAPTQQHELPAPIRAVVAESDLLVREGIERVLEGFGVEVLASVPDLPSLRSAVENLQPAVVVTEAALPPGESDEGIRFADELRRSAPEIGVLVLGTDAEADYATSLFVGDGAPRGYLLKPRIVDRGRFAEALAAVALGGSYLDTGVMPDFLESRERDDALARLTPREREILARMADGKSNAAIARELGVTIRAVERHIGSIFAKLGLEESPDVSRRVLAVLCYLADSGR
jgi:DNA-binding NarL/FixJ family response regulator